MLFTWLDEQVLKDDEIDTKFRHFCLNEYLYYSKAYV